MAERIKARVGDTIETSFNLAYKKAEIARLPNAAKYATFDFFMMCEKGSKLQIGASREFVEGVFIRCQSRDITQDDQPVVAQFHFGGTMGGSSVFSPGDLWRLYLAYCAKEGSPSGDPKDPDSHLLAEVELQGADAGAPAKS